MATLSELYKYLEDKKDQSHIDGDFPWLSFGEKERDEARLEILTWWNIKHIVGDDGCPIDRVKALAYFDRRIDSTGNQYLLHRYCYFSYLLSNNRKYAEKAIDSLISCLEDLILEEKGTYPSHTKDAIATLLSLSRKIKYNQKNSETLIWRILDSDCGSITKLLILEEGKQCSFFTASHAFRIVEKCKQILPTAPGLWKDRCCEIGLFFSAKLQDRGKTYMSFFYEALGDIQMTQLVDITSDTNNIALPHINDSHLEKAMIYYKEAGITSKMLETQKLYASNRKNLQYIHFVSRVRTNPQVVAYFQKLNDDLLNGDFSSLMWNLVCPVQYLFPSLKLIKERMTSDVKSLKTPCFSDRIKDINGNSQDADVDFQLWKYYETWLLNIVRNPLLELILSAVKQRKMTYSKIRTWMNRNTCFGIPIEYARNDAVVAYSWFSQIDYAIKSLLQQYQRTIDKKPTDWRIPIEVLSLRFEGILRTIVSDQEGKTIRVDRRGNTSEAMLDGLLREKCLLKVFAEEDIEFFEYVLTSKGLNIRNNVAHAFYIPQDYGIICSTLVFLCILRLAKFRP